jgi:hypothetical protein
LALPLEEAKMPMVGVMILARLALGSSSILKKSLRLLASCSSQPLDQKWLLHYLQSLPSRIPTTLSIE